MMMRMYRYRNGNLRLKLLTGSEKWPPSLHLSKVPSLKLYSETFSEHESAKVSRITYSLTNFQVSSSFDTRLSIRSGPVGSGSVRSVQCMMTVTGCWQGVRDNTFTVWSRSTNSFVHIIFHLQIFFTYLQIFLFRSSYTDSLRSNNNDHPVTGLKQHHQPASVLDINKEKRTQKFLLLILISHFLCILPIHIVK